MQITETLSEGLKREYTITVAAADLEAKMTAKIDSLAREAQLPGFRPGKVPPSLLRKTYGRQVLGEVLEETVNASSSEALQQHDLRPAMQPKIEVTQFEDGGDLQYKMEVEVMPEIEPGDLASIELERLVAAVDDAAVDERIAAMAKQLRSFVPAAEGQAAADGDTLTIDFVGSIDGEAFDGGKAEDFQLELGSGAFIPGFEAQLAGAKKDDAVTVEVEFPDDYGNDELAGKAASFAVTVKDVQVPLPVPIDDSMAEKLGLENLDALKTAVREQVARDYAGLSRARLKRALLDQLAERHSFDVPDGMSELEFQSIWEQVQQDLTQQGKSIADLDQSEDEMQSEYRAIAERRVRLGLLLSEIGRLNNIEVSQDEVNRAISEQARRYPGQERQVFEFYQGNAEAESQLRAPILEDKVVDFIVEMAKVEERAVPLAELLADPDDEEGEDAAAPDETEDGKPETA